MYDVLKYKHADLTKDIIGCAMKVHRYFGAGFPEVVYQRAMMIELANANINARSEVEGIVKYYDEIVGKRRIDIIVEDKVLIELKAVIELDNGCYNQVVNCLKVFNYEVGLLLNFGRQSLEFRRFVKNLDRKN
jgi:GxxExxY protein